MTAITVTITGSFADFIGNSGLVLDPKDAGEELYGYYFNQGTARTRGRGYSLTISAPRWFWNWTKELFTWLAEARASECTPAERRGATKFLADYEAATAEPEPEGVAIEDIETDMAINDGDGHFRWFFGGASNGTTFSYRVAGDMLTRHVPLGTRVLVRTAGEHRAAIKAEALAYGAEMARKHR